MLELAAAPRFQVRCARCRSAERARLSGRRQGSLNAMRVLDCRLWRVAGAARPRKLRRRAGGVRPSQGALASSAAMRSMYEGLWMPGSKIIPFYGQPHKALAPALAGASAAHKSRAQRLYIIARSAGSGGNVLDRPSLLPGQDTR